MPGDELFKDSTEKIEIESSGFEELVLAHFIADYHDVIKRFRHRSDSPSNKHSDCTVTATLDTAGKTTVSPVHPSPLPQTTRGQEEMNI
jgi:hypothetical protein